MKAVLPHRTTYAALVYTIPLARRKIVATRLGTVYGARAYRIPKYPRPL
jgi:hypothetical protein